MAFSGLLTPFAPSAVSSQLIKTFIGALKAKRFLYSLFSLSIWSETDTDSEISACWMTISECARMLSTIRADESHLAPLAHSRAQVLESLSPCYSEHASNLLSRTHLRLEEIKRQVGTKRATNATSAAALERESVRFELAQHGLLFDFPSVEVEAAAAFQN